MAQSVSLSVDVHDLQEATQFYENALACKLKKQYSDSWLVLTVAGLDIHLLEKAAGTVAAAGQKRRFERHWTPVHLDFGVDDVEAASDLVKQHGGTVESIEKAEIADIAFCADPSGNGFCLIRESI